MAAVHSTRTSVVVKTAFSSGAVISTSGPSTVTCISSKDVLLSLSVLLALIVYTPGTNIVSSKVPPVPAKLGSKGFIVHTKLFVKVALSSSASSTVAVKVVSTIRLILIGVKLLVGALMVTTGGVSVGKSDTKQMSNPFTEGFWDPFIKLTFSTPSVTVASKDSTLATLTSAPETPDGL